VEKLKNKIRKESINKEIYSDRHKKKTGYGMGRGDFSHSMPHDMENLPIYFISENILLSYDLYHKIKIYLGSSIQPLRNSKVQAISSFSVVSFLSLAHIVHVFSLVPLWHSGKIAQFLCLRGVYVLNGQLFSFFVNLPSFWLHGNNTLCVACYLHAEDASLYFSGNRSYKNVIHKL
jgi:hypothetical protein